MNETQSHLLGLLREIDDICSQHGLKYYLAGGSLVGAMRNHGFLPWDDDADIHMTRADAEALLDLSHKGLLPENRQVVCYHDYDDVPLLHWRYEDLSTSVILRSTYTTGVPQGQFVDIFVLNPAPAGEQEQAAYDEDFRLYWDLFANHLTDARRSDRHLKRYAHWTFLRKHGLEGYLHKHFRKRLFELPEDSSDEYSILSPAAPKLFMKKEIFGTPRRVPFEDTELCVAEQAEEMLCFAYGTSWVELPRVQERDEHTFIIDYDLPYTYYLHDFDAITDRFEGGRLSWQWKNDFMGGLHLRNSVNPATHTIKHLLFAQGLELIWGRPDEETGLVPREVYPAQVRAHTYEENKAFFGSYFRMQMGENASYWGLFVPISDEMLWCAWYPEFMLGDYSRTLKILGRRQAWSDAPLSDELAELVAQCECANELTYQLWTRHDVEETQRLLEPQLATEVPSVIFLRAQLACPMLLQPESCDYGWCLAQAEQAMELYPNDGELAFWRAEALTRLGRGDEAVAWYELARRYLVNGILLTRTQDVLATLQEVDA